MYQAVFRMDDFIVEGRSFIGYTNGEKWNGWGCPRFTFDEARRIADVLDGWYDEATDSFCFTSDFPEPECYERNSDGLYAIGAWCWVWYEDERVTDGVRYWHVYGDVRKGISFR